MTPIKTPIKTLSDSIELVSNNNIEILQIRHPVADAAISLHGGHLIQFKPAGQKDIIWLSKKAEFDTSKAIRGGVPVCWPWFGRIAAPAHGFSRTSQWNLLSHQESTEGVVICLRLNDSDVTRAAWPHAFEAVLTFTIGTELKIDLTVTNTDSQPWHSSGALHSYFNLSDAGSCHITGMGSEYLNSLKGNEPTVGGDQLMIDQSIDRVYLTPANNVCLHDDRFQRNINIVNDGHNAAVIWNPWEDITKGMGDMVNDGYKTMVCIESTWFAKELSAGLEVLPGQSHSLSTTIGLVD